MLESWKWARKHLFVEIFLSYQNKQNYVILFY